MRRDQILHLAMDQYQLFLAHFKWSLISDEAEYIHQFRVSVKKLNALKLLISDPQLWDFVQAVYKTGGKVRNVQVLLELLTTFVAVVPEDFKQYLYDRLQKKRGKHDKVAATVELLTEKQFFEALNAFVGLHYTGEARLESIIQSHSRRACELIQKNGAGEAWHEARKYFKECAHLIQMAESLGEALFLDEGFYRYREMEQLLGRWHDLYVLNKLADKYRWSQGNKGDALWTSFINEKTDITLRTEAEVCLLADAFTIP